MSLSTPQQVEQRLQEIAEALALLENEMEPCALAWFRAKREREKAKARAFLTAKGTDSARRADAELESAGIGADEEGRWEGKKAKLKTLETAAVIGTSLLRAQSRS